MENLSPGQIPNIPPLPKSPKPNMNSAWGKPRPVQTFFFEREDGSIIEASEDDAWSIYSGKTQMIGEIKQRPKYIGQTNGVNYYNAVIQSQKVFNELGLEGAQEILRKARLEAIEEAKLNKQPPRNFDVIDSRGQPINLRTYGN